MDSHTFLLLRDEVRQRNERDLANGQAMLGVLINLGNYLRRLTKSSAEIGTVSAGELQKDKFEQRDRKLIAFGIRFIFTAADGGEIFSRTFPLEITIVDGDFLVERTEVEEGRDSVTIPLSKVDSDDHLAKVIDMLDGSISLAVHKYVNN